MISTPLRILLVEDNEADVLLTRRALSKIVQDPEIEVVEDLSTCRNKLSGFIPDLVISDYNLPTCTGLDILELVTSKDLQLPVIFLTGTIDDEELAANTVLARATGFVLKKDMIILEEKLRPMLKKIVFGMTGNSEVRERLRQNKIAINQINDYLDSQRAGNKEQRENLGRLKEALRKNKDQGNDDDNTA